MTTEEAARVNALYRKHVCRHGPVDLSRLREVVKAECLAAERGTVQVSPGLLTELRDERAFLGRVAAGEAAERILRRRSF